MTTRINVAKPRPFILELETTKPDAKRRTWKQVADAKTLIALFDAFAAAPKKDQGVYRLRNGRRTYRTYRYTYVPGRNSRGNIELIENRKANV